MKKALAILLALMMLFAFAACGDSGSPSPTGGDSSSSPSGGDDTSPSGGDEESPSPEQQDKPEFSGDVTLNVMLMPQGDMNSDIVAKVTQAVNDRIAELGYEFKVSFSWSGGAWGFETLDTELQTGSGADIIPAHAWSGSVNYLAGAETGTYLRLDTPGANYLEWFGENLYKNTAQQVKDAATVPGKEGEGIYGYIIEKDSASQLGFLVNNSIITELGLDIANFDPNDINSWEPFLAAYKEAYPNKYPLNVEAEVLDRTVNHIAYVGNPSGPLGFVFNNADISGTKPELISRYENPAYKTFITKMHDYYNAGYVDPNLGIVGSTSSDLYAKNRGNGDFLFCTFVYAPGAENPIIKSASEAQGKDVDIKWVPAWSSAVMWADSVMGSGLAVYAGTKYAPEAVTFLDMLASDQVIGDLLSEGLPGESHEVTDGIAWRLPDRAGWNIWRYGVVGATSGATPLGDVDASGQEWANFKTFNADAKLIVSGMFYQGNVATEYDACWATIGKFSVPLGSGAAGPDQYDAFITELKAAGIDAVVADGKTQFDW